MRHSLHMVIVVAGALAPILFLSGCPLLPQPPFDASGDYTGSWESNETKAACPFTMSLIHKADFIYPFNHQVIGTVEFSYGCLIDNELLTQIQDELPELVIPVFGSLKDDGSGALSLGIDTDTLEFPFSINLQFDGTGVDEDEDGVMDSYAGTYSLSFHITTDVEGYESVDFDSAGAFEAQRGAAAD